VPAEGYPDMLTRLGQNAFGVTFVEPANPYQSVERSLKYALLFVGLVFLAYFIFETLSDKRVHPAQYVLIGLAQSVFYLLLLSLAERVGFDTGFLVAAAATVVLISVYAFWVFATPARGLQALVAFSVLYALIYVLMRLEDSALLVGALAGFAAIAAVMYFTRKIDWYGGAAPSTGPLQPATERP
jgi:inner membrane protein